MAKKKKKRGRRSRIVLRRLVEVGAPPGDLRPRPGARACSTRVLSYDASACDEACLASVGDVAAWRGKRHVLWLDIDGADDAAALAQLGGLFGLHALALEDATSEHQLPKAEDYGDHVYVVMRLPVWTEGLAFHQISLFVGPDFVVTIQERGADALETVRERVRQGRGRVRGEGCDFLGYTILDAIVDHYFPIVETINGRLDELEGQIMNARGEEAVADVHAIRHDLYALRRICERTKGMVSTLGRDEMGPFGRDTYVFLRDCQDHVVQLLDTIDACRELSTGLMDLHMAGVSARMNEVMKVLTLIATIFIPLGFIAGVYGMNFDAGASRWNMPELRWALGYPFALGLMSVTAFCLVWFFWRRGWLGTHAANGASAPSKPPPDAPSKPPPDAPSKPAAETSVRS